MMHPRETVKAAFRFEETGVVPYWIPMEPAVEQGLDAHYGNGDWRDRIVPYFDARLVGFKMENIDERTARDPFGMVVERGNITHLVTPPLANPSLEGYQWPDAEALDDWDAAIALFEGKADTFCMAGLGFGIYERAWCMRGMTNFLSDLIESPAFAEELLDGVLDVHIKAMDLIADRFDIEAYYGADDWSDQRGPMMGLDLWRQYFKPRTAKLVAHAHELGLPFICHSCGNVLPLIDDLIEMEMDGLESLQPEAMNVFELKRRTAGRMALVGGLGAQSTLPFGTPDEVRQTTDKLIREMGAGGGYVLAPSKPVMADVPAANAAALIETVCNQQDRPT